MKNEYYITAGIIPNDGKVEVTANTYYITTGITPGTIIKFFSNGNVYIPGEIDETKSYFRILCDGCVECSEFDEISLVTTPEQRIYDDYRFHITGELSEI